MKKEKTYYIPIGVKKFPLIITYTGKMDEDNGEIIHILCDWAGLNQNYLKEDIPTLLEDIEELIISEQSENKNTHINIRIRPSDKKKIEENALKNGYKNVSEFIKDRCIV